MNDTEFYRYEPTANGRNNVKQFKVKGVKIDVSILNLFFFISYDLILKF